MSIKAAVRFFLETRRRRGEGQFLKTVLIFSCFSQRCGRNGVQELRSAVRSHCWMKGIPLAPPQAPPMYLFPGFPHSLIPSVGLPHLECIRSRCRVAVHITEPCRHIWMAEGSLEVALLPFKPRDKPVTLLRWLLFRVHAFACGIDLMALF